MIIKVELDNFLALFYHTKKIEKSYYEYREKYHEAKSEGRNFEIWGTLAISKHKEYEDIFRTLKTLGLYEIYVEMDKALKDYDFSNSKTSKKGVGGE